MTAIEFTTEELLALASLLGLPSPVVLAGPPISEWNSELRSEVDLLGARSLFARRLARQSTNGVIEVPEALRQMARSLSHPETSVSVLRVAAGRGEAVLFLVYDGVAAGMRPAVAGNFAISLIRSTDLAEALTELLALPQTTQKPGKSFEMDLDAVGRLLQAATDSTSDLSALLGRAGLAAPAAEAVRAMSADGSTATIVRIINHRPGPDGVLGSVTAWIDVKGSGLFLAEPGATGDTETIRVVPATSDEVMESLSEGCPEWLRLSA
jgi:hypothetical protein